MIELLRIFWNKFNFNEIYWGSWLFKGVNKNVVYGNDLKKIFKLFYYDYSLGNFVKYYIYKVKIMIFEWKLFCL